MMQKGFWSSGEVKNSRMRCHQIFEVVQCLTLSLKNDDSNKKNLIGNRKTLKYLKNNKLRANFEVINLKKQFQLNLFSTNQIQLHTRLALIVARTSFSC